VAFSERVIVCIQAPFSRCETDGRFLNQTIQDHLERRCEVTRSCNLHVPRASQTELWGAEREIISDINEYISTKT
jgi:hypothetical protein